MQLHTVLVTKAGSFELRRAGKSDFLEFEGSRKKLEPLESRLFLFLAERLDADVSKLDLYGAWYPDGGKDAKVIDVTACKLRKKLVALGAERKDGPRYLHTIWGTGYRLSSEACELSSVTRRSTGMTKKLRSLESARTRMPQKLAA